MKKFVLSVLMLVITLSALYAQTNPVFLLDSAHNGTTIDITGQGNVSLTDDGGISGSYTTGHDYTLTLHLDCGASDTTGTRVASIRIIADEEDIDCSDTLYIYDGSSTADPLLVARNSCYATNPNLVFYTSPLNTSGNILVRFVTSPRITPNTHRGFRLEMECSKPCEHSTPVIEPNYDRVDLLTHEILEEGLPIQWVPDLLDTVCNDDGSVIRIDTLSLIPAILICQGQGVALHGHGTYTANYGRYTPSDATSLFRWDLNGQLQEGVNLTTAYADQFQYPGCYDVMLRLTDSLGCESSTLAQVQCRVAQNPIKTIFDLDPICSNDSTLFNIGYEGEEGRLTLKRNVFAQNARRTLEQRTFIPDGPESPDVDQCYRAELEFTEFGSARITSAADIESICINYEHSYMGDYRLSILCPSYDPNVSTTSGRAILKYGSRDPYAPSGQYNTGSGAFTGYPLDGSPWDASGTQTFDPLYNPFGIGLDYCWSRNHDYTLISGEPADTTYDDPSMYITYANHSITNLVNFGPIPTDFLVGGGTTPSPQTITTRTPSDPVNKADFYRPESDFSDLVGCPINGTWAVEICDFLKFDNGWVFGWTMEISNHSSNAQCDYQVGISSVEMYADEAVAVSPRSDNPLDAYLSTPNTSGDFLVGITLNDEYGCVWNTQTNLTSVRMPEPHLGNDTALCLDTDITLDARDSYAALPTSQYTYRWGPNGESSPTIQVAPQSDHPTTYIAQVTNTLNDKRCVARDSIVVSALAQPIPGFDPGIYPLEGCEPYTVQFLNNTVNGYRYRWDFGDGNTSSLESPTHTYGAGDYTLRYYVQSEAGCQSSLEFQSLVHVFPNPTAEFSWEPAFPSVQHPSVQLINKTSPDNPDNIYHWAIQYETNNPVPETFESHDLQYTFTADDPNTLAGNHYVKLYCTSLNYGPSGHPTQCSDTAEATILFLNDNLIYPNVVTPNGDGKNDLFVIGNLIEGGAFPYNELVIFDRYGITLFRASNINQTHDFWDPMRTNTPAGTYFYQFTGRGPTGNTSHNGVIEVIK